MMKLTDGIILGPNGQAANEPEAIRASQQQRPTRETLPAEVVRYRLACYVPDPEGGVSLMRGLGPLSEMAREDRRLEIVLPRRDEHGNWALSWDWLAGCDAFYMQGPYKPVHSRAAVMAKMMGLPVWIDWDDDLTCVPDWNPLQARFPMPQTELEIKRLVKLADVITVSTAELGRRREKMARMMDEERDKVSVLPNGCMWQMSGGPRERRVLWRGWGNHHGDIDAVLSDLAKVSHLPEFSEWKWTFVGEAPWQVKDVIPPQNLDGDPGADPFLYMQILQRLQPWVVICPLRDCGFNRCRSNLAWLEGTVAGAVVIAPDWEEFRRPGVLNYDNGGVTFESALTQTLRLYEDIAKTKTRKEHVEEHAAVAESRRYVEEFLRLKKLNAFRWEILRKMRVACCVKKEEH